MDANAPLPFAIRRKTFQPISGWIPQVLNILSRIDIPQAPRDNSATVAKRRLFSVKKFFLVSSSRKETITRTA